MGRFVGASSLLWVRVPSRQKSSAPSSNISLASKGNRPDCVSDGFARVWSRACMTLTSVTEVKVEPPVTTHSSPWARIASMYRSAWVVTPRSNAMSAGLCPASA